MMLDQDFQLLWFYILTENVKDILIPSSLADAILILNKKELTSLCSITNILKSYG